MDISRILSILIQATFITLIYLFVFLTAKLLLWADNNSTNLLIHRTPTTRFDATWNEFIVDHAPRRPSPGTLRSILSYLHMCNASTIVALSSPRLSREEYDWCLWAKSASGGNVSPRTSWGNLKAKTDRTRYQSLQCSELHDRKESCNELEGDSQIQNWRRTRVHEDKLSCDARRPSSQRCYQNNSDLYCELENVMIDFSKYHNATRVNRFGETLKVRSFEQNFMSSDCIADRNTTPPALSILPVGHLYSTHLSSKHCDVILPGPVLLYSHDYLENFGHTINDFMNVWRMLWLSGLAGDTKNVDILNVDGLLGSRSYNEQPNPWFYHYHRYFRSVLMGHDYVNKTVCVKRLLVQPVPNTFFVFKYWHADDKCGTKIGPSSLFQRYNLHVRGLFTGNNISSRVKLPSSSSSGVFRIVVIVRKESDNLAGTSSKTSRLILNLQQIQSKLEGIVRDIQKELDDCDAEVDVIYQDLSALSYEEQLQLIGRTNILIGMHGAGIPQSLHMSIGSLPNCCGVIEIFPAGEFTLIRAHGNMVRRMGLKYDRIDISKNDSYSHGATVPVDELSSKLLTMVRQVHSEPTCILPAVVEDPFLSW